MVFNVDAIDNKVCQVARGAYVCVCVCVCVYVCNRHFNTIQNGGLTTQHDTEKRRESFLFGPFSEF